MNPIFSKAKDAAKARFERSLKEVEAQKQQTFAPSPFSVQAIGDKNIDFSIIFSTSNGVFILDPKNGIQQQILEGKYYGITKQHSRWFFSRSNNQGDRDHTKNDRISDISSAKIINYQIKDYSVNLFGIPGEVHQIDIFEDQLIFPHSGYNQILSIETAALLKAEQPIWFDAYQSIPLSIKEPSHLNSIYVNKEKIYLIAHNYTMRTGRLSDLIVYDKNTLDVQIKALKAHSAHNICVLQGDLYYCDSNNKKLFKNQAVYFEGDKLLRGLSINDKYIFVGGSDICFDNYKRFSNSPSIYLLDRFTGKHISTFILPDLGDLYEIRQFKAIDYAMSTH